MGGRGDLRLWLTVSPAFLLLVVVSTLPALVESACGINAVVFNFGDSNSDTGGLMAGLGYQILPPAGRLFFHRSTGRLCDGRLVLDFLCESLNMSYLSPYLQSLGSDFRNGANFAISGSTTLPPDIPFSLHIQVNQFLRFKARTLELIAQGINAELLLYGHVHQSSKGLLNKEGFQKALYAIDIGQNDLSAAFGANLPYDQVIQRIPSAISEIKTAVKTLYGSGGKNFWIHNTGPLGCLPQKLSLPRKDNSNLDQYGCLMPFNNAAREFNAQLNILCNELRSELNDATIVYTDIFTIKYDIIANHTTYGFENPLMACCGFGGPPYNFNQNLTCGNAACSVCPESSKYVNWDGIHYTEAANAIVASKILTTKYSKPEVKFDFFCTA